MDRLKCFGENRYSKALSFDRDERKYKSLKKVLTPLSFGCRLLTLSCKVQPSYNLSVYIKLICYNNQQKRLPTITRQ